MEPLSHFEEKAGIVASTHEWGRWYQSVAEVNVEIKLVPGTKAKELSVSIKPNHLECRLVAGGQVLLKGKLFGTIKMDESTWTIEEKKTLRVSLAKAAYSIKECFWSGLFEDAYQADPATENRMKEKLDLERFQLEYPGLDFSQSRLQKN